MIRKPIFTVMKSFATGILLTTSLTSVMLAVPHAVYAQPAAISDEAGHDYIVKSGDGLYKLGRQFFGKGSDYKKIVRAHNAKAATDSRYTKIDPDKGLEIGQVIWIPVKKSNTNVATAKQLRDLVNKRNAANPTANSSNPPKPATSGSSATGKEKISSEKLVNDYTLPTPKADSSASKNVDDPAYVVTLPKTNCEIRIWYNFQLVAIKKINERWKEQGIDLIERARRAYEIRHQARLNGRYMMQDKFEVAALRDRDNKKYGNPDGPTFEHMVAFGKENGLTGDRVYEGIIESSSRVQPVYKSSCVN